MDGRDMLNSVFCDELLAEILCRVRNPIDCKRVSLVCKRWLKVLRNAQSTLGLCMPSDATGASTFCASVCSLLAQHPYITSLSIKSKSHATAELLVARVVTAVTFSCTSLKHFHFTAGLITVSVLQELSKGCPNLTSLEILQPPTSRCLPVLSEFKALQELCLHGYPEDVVYADDDVDVKGSSVYGPLQLTKLCLMDMRSCSACDLRWLWCSCRHLRKLKLLCCEGVGDTTLSAFLHCMPSLHEVQLHQCRAIAGEVLTLISEHSPELKALTVHDGANTQGLRQVLQRCRALELLDLRLPLDLNNEDLMEIAQSGRCLRRLCLHSCCLATGEGMRSLAYNITSDLEELVLVRCRAIVQDPGTLSALGQSLPNLKNIDLSENEYLDDKELAAMLTSCERLCHLNLWKCHRLTDRVVDLISQRCLMLESIDIRSCEGISMKALTSLLMGCGHLKVVGIESNKLTKAAKKLAFIKGIAFVEQAAGGGGGAMLAYQNT